MNEPLLVTISFSHYCEKARWALDHARIRYRESAHQPGFHVLAVRRAGGKRTTPTLVTAGGVLTDSTDILRWIDAQRPEAGLFGKTAEERREIERLESLFDEDLGPHVRRFAYFHLLPDRALTRRMFSDQPDTPAWERAAMPVVLPVLSIGMRRSMRIDAAGAARSLDKATQVFETVAERLADGRRYLVGDAFSAADLTFAALATPALLPEETASRLLPLEALPAALRPQMEAWRAHPAGAFALRMMRDHRRS